MYGSLTCNTVFPCTQDLLLLQLQTALLGWEAGAAGDVRTAAALQGLLALLDVETTLPPELVGKAVTKLLPAEREHIVSVLVQTNALTTSTGGLEQLLGLLAAQQPTIFMAAGQGQRAAVLDPLLACQHLQYVVHSLLQRDSRGYAMHHAAIDAGPVQLRVLQMLGADLNMMYIDKRLVFPVPATPLVLACTSVGEVDACEPHTQEQQEVQQEEPPWLHQRRQQQLALMMSPHREGRLLDKGGNYTDLIQRRLEVVQLLVETGASLAIKGTPSMQSALSAAARAGLYPLLDYVLPSTLAALGDESELPPNKRQLSLAIRYAARAGNVRCLRLLMGAAAGGPASEEAKAALCHMVSSAEGHASALEATKLLLAEGVPVNGHVHMCCLGLLSITTPLHALMSRSSNQYSLVSGWWSNTR
jgi:hypothetical protein